MKTLDDQLSNYAACHRDPRNVPTHFIGITQCMRNAYRSKISHALICLPQQSVRRRGWAGNQPSQRYSVASTIQTTTS